MKLQKKGFDTDKSLTMLYTHEHIHRAIDIIFPYDEPISLCYDLTKPKLREFFEFRK